jgi:hypothetical protein
LSETFEITPNMHNLTVLNILDTNITKIVGFENLTSKEKRIYTYECSIENPEEFLKLRDIKQLLCSVPDYYSDDEINALWRMLRENNPDASEIVVIRASEDIRPHIYRDT